MLSTSRPTWRLVRDSKIVGSSDRWNPIEDVSTGMRGMNPLIRVAKTPFGRCSLVGLNGYQFIRRKDALSEGCCGR